VSVGGRIVRLGGALAHRGRRFLWSRQKRKTGPRHAGMVARSEVRRQLEDGARRLGMTREEFYRQFDAGTLPDTPSVAHLRMLAGDRRH
jgi:hypothetical protein